MKRFAFISLFLAYCATAKTDSPTAVPAETCASKSTDTCTIPLVAPPVPEVATTSTKKAAKKHKKPKSSPVKTDATAPN